MKSVVVVCILFSILSCGPSLYVPNAVNMPLMAEKGDGQIRLALGETETSSPSVEIFGAYALKHHMSILGGYSYIPLENYYNNSNDKSGSSKIVELGGGYFTSFGKEAYHGQEGRFEVNGIISRGWANNGSTPFLANPSDVNEYTGQYTRFAIQPAIGFTHEIVELSAGLRLSHVYFSEFRHTENNVLMENSTFGFGTLEPVSRVSVGYKSVKGYLQMNLIYPIDATDYYKVADEITGLFPFGFWTGIVFKFGEK